MKNLIIVFAVFLIAALGCKMTGTNSTNSESVSKNSNSNIGSNNSNSKEQTKVSDPTKGADSKEELLNAFKRKIVNCTDHFVARSYRCDMDLCARCAV